MQLGIPGRHCKRQGTARHQLSSGLGAPKDRPAEGSKSWTGGGSWQDVGPRGGDDTCRICVAIPVAREEEGSIEDILMSEDLQALDGKTFPSQWGWGVRQGLSTSCTSETTTGMPGRSME